MKQSLQLKLGQQLTMTPQLQQAIRLLQLSTLDLQQEIQEALDSNPMLEISEDEASSQHESRDNTPEAGSEHSENLAGDGNSDTHTEANGQDPDLSHPEGDAARDDYLNQSAQESDTSSANGQGEVSGQNETSGAGDEQATDSDWNEDIPADLPVDTDWDDVYQSSSAPSSPSGSNGEDIDYESRRGVTESLQDHLLWQLNLTPMSETDQIIAMAIIDAIEPSGMLGTSIEDIHQDLLPSFEEELELDEVVAVLHRLQQFDPSGVAARNLSDCLLIQLRQHGPETPYLAAAQQIIKDYLPLLGSRDYKQLMRRTKLKEQELAATIQLIQSLNPRPGDQIGEDNTEYVVPDVFVTKREGRWTVQLNPDIAPKIRINPNYASLVKRADSSEDNTFLRDNLQEARWFLKSLLSRNETLLKVASCIVEKQRGFLDYGEEAMKPLVLHDIAEAVGMHESTISRVTTQKYMHTPKGIFELKYFFSSHVSTDSGGECSSTAIRALIKKLIAAESPQKPLSDSKITAMLADQGIKVARRTIAKYRESLNIPASNERKRLL